MELTLEKPDSETLMARIGQLIDQGRPGAARPLLSAVRGLARPSARISVLAARLALSEGALDTAADELDRAIATDPHHAGLRKCRAELRYRCGDLEGAARDAAEALILDRDDPTAKAILGELLLHLSRPDDAVACLAEAVSAQPTDVVFRDVLASALAARGDVDGALLTLLEGIALVPAATATRDAAVLMCIRRRDYEQAEQLAEQARQDGVADAATYALRGHALSSLGRHKDAAMAYREALKLAPDDPYIRHLASIGDIDAGVSRTPDDFVRGLFDDCAERFEAHLRQLGYRIPGLIRRHVLAFAAEGPVGSVLDLGCGTGLVAQALADLPVGPITGVDLSPRMLDLARAKGLYDDLQEARLPDFLLEETATWPLIIAADVVCYFGALDELFRAVHSRLTPGGRFIFSVEELLPDHDGTIRGNGAWFLGRLGRFAHVAKYVARTADDLGFSCAALERQTLRQEAGGPVTGLVVVLDRPRENA